MVAITVILAAVIAAFVFGMVGNVKKANNVAVTATRDGNIIAVTYNGGPDSGEVSSLTLGGRNSANTADLVFSPTQLTSVGTVATVSDQVTIGHKTHVIVTGLFKDGTQSVVLDELV